MKQDALDSQGEESPKEVVSRSGRKIKPKRFADFSSSEETDIADKNCIYYQLYLIKLIEFDRILFINILI